MQRSGSTLMFNMIRLLIITHGQQSLSAGYIKDLGSLGRSDTSLIKIHGLPRLTRWRASAIFYTYRDVRTAIVSQFRKFHDVPHFEFIERSIREFKTAQKADAVMIKYEDLISEPEKQIERISRKLALNADVEAIWQKVNSIKQPSLGEGYSKETLFHPYHKTATGDNDWRQVLDESLTSKINDEFGWWFQACGYPEV